MDPQAAVDRWREARSRILAQAKTADSVTSSDVEPSAERTRLGGLLDDVIQPEFYRAMGIDSEEMRWSAWRQDDHGTQYEIERSMSLGAAQARLRDLVAREHKQMYWTALTITDDR